MDASRIAQRTSDELKAWKEQRKLLKEVQRNGEVVTSKGKWFAQDRGNGVCTMGVFNCVGIATPELVAHISADRQIPSDKEFHLFCSALKKQGISHIELYGLPERLIAEVEEALSSYGISYTEHLSTDKSKSFIIVVKDKQIHEFLD